MSRKNKAARAFFHQNPDATPKEAWDAAWANDQARFASKKHERQQEEIERLRAIIDAISEMEGQEGMTDSEFAKSALLIIAHGAPWPATQIESI